MTAFFDTTILGAVTNPTPKSESVKAIIAWTLQMEAAGHRIIVPAIADYEVRREQERRGAINSIAALDAFSNAVPGRYLNLTDSALKRAALLWANLRQQGLATADIKSLDCDLVLAAQVLAAQVLAAQVLAAQVLDLDLPPQTYVVVTNNVAHLSRVISCDEWQNIIP